MTFINMIGQDLNRRIEALWQLLRYLEKERHPEDSQFWHSCLGRDFKRSHFLMTPEEMPPVQSLRGRH
ncbi:MAG: hypothetical protein DSM106950_13775 [Stigonema ocellatum SAG 48.90 = DSM 106950]|nr:hypothetical protein [Stigonema ocellatum SAG 48.90 = DSM 106950]